MPSFTIVTQFSSGPGSTPIVGTKTIDGDVAIEGDFTIPANATAYAIALPIDVSRITKSYLLSTGDLTIKTNSSSAQDDTIPLVAGIDVTDFAFTEDVVTLYVVNAASSAVTLYIRIMLEVAA